MKLGQFAGTLVAFSLLGIAARARAATEEGVPADGDAAAPAAYPPAGYPPAPPGYPPPPPGYAPGPDGQYVTREQPERSAKNSIYIEGLGPGILYSLNYDRIFGDFAGRVGFSYLSLSASSGDQTSGGEAHASLVTVPLTLTYLGIGSKKNIFELGAGVTIFHVGAGASTFAVDDSKSASSSTTLLLGNMIFGYRLQPPEGGFMLRTGISPVFGGGVFVPLPYLALGGTF